MCLLIPSYLFFLSLFTFHFLSFTSLLLSLLLIFSSAAFDVDIDWDSQAETSEREESPADSNAQATGPDSPSATPSPSPSPSSSTSTSSSRYWNSPWRQFIFGKEALPFTQLRELAKIAIPAIPKTALPRVDNRKNRASFLELLGSQRPDGPNLTEVAYLSHLPDPEVASDVISPMPSEPLSGRQPWDESTEIPTSSLRSVVTTLRQELRRDMQEALSAANVRAKPPSSADPSDFLTQPSTLPSTVASVSGEQHLLAAQACRASASSVSSSSARPPRPQQSTSGMPIPSRVSEKAKEAILEGKYLPAQYYHGRPLHMASEFAPEKRTSLGSNSDGELLTLVASSSNAAKSTLPLPIEDEFSLLLAVNNWLLSVASLRPDLIADALLLSSDVMFFLDEYRCWQGALSYFDEIRRNRAVDGRESNLSLGLRDGFLFNKCALDTAHLHRGNRRFAGQQLKRTPTGNSSPDSTTGSKKEAYCINWNTSKCKRGDSCPYTHRCKSCDGDHRSRDCSPKPPNGNGNASQSASRSSPRAQQAAESSSSR